MRNKYTKDFENEMILLAPTHTLNDLLDIAKNKYQYQININQLRQYLSKRSITYNGYNLGKVRNMGDRIPIGTERTKPDGMVQVKVAPNKWEYKQRLIYSKYYDVNLTDNDYIVFLDQDRTNFDISNLKKISRHESAIVANQKMFSNNPDITNTGIGVAKLMIKLKEVKSNGRHNKMCK